MAPLKPEFKKFQRIKIPSPEVFEIFRAEEQARGVQKQILAAPKPKGFLAKWGIRLRRK